MSIQVKAVYENGVFRPLQPVPFAERERVTVTVEVAERPQEGTEQVHFTLPADRWQAFCDALDAAPKDIPALRKLLTEGSLFDGDGAAAF